ncbi:MAG: RepB family plasmid replication initiator protein [Selenomonadaceae bacterium]|nr:RepB family plasmid replication initiator protein [Selenomonadaceae bacterium]
MAYRIEEGAHSFPLRNEVYQSNLLINARKAFDLMGMRIFVLGLRGLNPHFSKKDRYFDEDFKETFIPSSELTRLFNNTKYLSDMKNACRKLFNTTIEIKNSDGEVTLTHVFKKLEYDSSKGLHLKFADEMRPYLLNLVESNGYTRISAEYLFKLSSPYAVRLLELLLQYQNFQQFRESKEVKRKFTFDELRYLLNVPENAYKNRTDNFKKCVLDVPIREITERTPYKVHYKVIKTGRRLYAFEFILDTFDAPVEVLNSHRTYFGNDAITTLCRMGFSEKAAQEIYLKCNNVKDCFTRIATAQAVLGYQKKPVLNKLGFLRKAIEQNWQLPDTRFGNSAYTPVSVPKLGEDSEEAQIPTTISLETASRDVTEENQSREEKKVYTPEETWDLAIKVAKMLARGYIRRGSRFMSDDMVELEVERVFSIKPKMPDVKIVESTNCAVLAKMILEEKGIENPEAVEKRRREQSMIKSTTFETFGTLKDELISRTKVKVASEERKEVDSEEEIESREETIEKEESAFETFGTLKDELISRAEVKVVSIEEEKNTDTLKQSTDVAATENSSEEEPPVFESDSETDSTAAEEDEQNRIDYEKALSSHKTLKEELSRIAYVTLTVIIELSDKRLDAEEADELPPPLTNEEEQTLDKIIELTEKLTSTTTAFFANNSKFKSELETERRAIVKNLKTLVYCHKKALEFEEKLDTDSAIATTKNLDNIMKQLEESFYVDNDEQLLTLSESDYTILEEPHEEPYEESLEKTTESSSAYDNNRAETPVISSPISTVDNESDQSFSEIQQPAAEIKPPEESDSSKSEITGLGTVLMEIKKSVLSGTEGGSDSVSTETNPIHNMQLDLGDTGIMLAIIHFKKFPKYDLTIQDVESLARRINALLKIFEVNEDLIMHSCEIHAPHFDDNGYVTNMKQIGILKSSCDPDDPMAENVTYRSAAAIIHSIKTGDNFGNGDPYEGTILRMLYKNFKMTYVDFLNFCMDVFINEKPPKTYEIHSD